MTRTAPRTPSARKTGTTLQALLLGEPELGAEALTLLAAYRDAADAAKPAAEPSAAKELSPDLATDEVPSSVVSRTPPGVPRLRVVPGIEEPRLAALHGNLIAEGFLTAELLGRSDGLAYRVTRDGLRRLTGEVADAEAA